MGLHYSDDNVKLYHEENPLRAALWSSAVAAEIDVMILSLPFGSDRGSRRGLSYAEWGAGFTSLAGLIPRATCKVWLVHLGVERDATLGTKPWEYAVEQATLAGWISDGVYAWQRDDGPFTRDSWRRASNDQQMCLFHNGTADDLSERFEAILSGIRKDITDDDLFLAHLARQISLQYGGLVIGDPLADNGAVLAGVKSADGQARGIEPSQTKCDAIASLLSGGR